MESARLSEPEVPPSGSSTCSLRPAWAPRHGDKGPRPALRSLPLPRGARGPLPKPAASWGTRRLPRPRAGRRTAHLPRVWGGLCPRRPPARPARPACARAQPARPRVLSLVLLLHSRARARGSSPHDPPCEQGPRRLRDRGHGASAAAGQLPSVCPFKFHAAKPSSSQSCSVPLPYHVCKNRKVEIFNYSERSSFKLYI